MSWIKYTDSSNHPELKHGQKYCVRTSEGDECYAVFWVYEGGEEIEFIQVFRAGEKSKAVSVSEFRLLDKSVDFYSASGTVELPRRKK